MKKIILTLALAAGFAGAASAQGLKLGLKGGVNLSSFSGTDSTPFGYKYGFSAGGIANYGFTDMFSVQAELLYSQKGTNSDLKFDKFNAGTGISASGNLKQTLQYIDIPVLLKINTGDEGKGLFFELGPQASLAIAQRTFSDDASVKAIALATSLDANGKPVGDGVVIVNNPSANAKDSDVQAVAYGNSTDGLNKVVLAYVAGLGYQLTSGLGFGVRYTGDISQVYKDTKFAATGFSPVNVHNSVFQFQVHYMFGGK